MGLFVHEFFCSGAFANELCDNSLAREGLAMLAAVLEDFSRCLEERPTTTIDRRLRHEVGQLGLTARADIRWARCPEDERVLFSQLAAESDGTFVIAPESDGCLLERLRLVDDAGGKWLGHSADAIRLCGDKLFFSQHLLRRGLPAIPTALFDAFDVDGRLPFTFPIVVKPRDGAGSQDTFLIRDADEFARLRGTLASIFERPGHDAIVQPYVAGRALSVAALVERDPVLQPASRVHVFPAGEQILSGDGCFHYLGGRVPTQTPTHDVAVLIEKTCRSISGLSGYIGFDLIAPADSPMPVIVEANPRLTTAYLGYRRLSKENLAARMLQRENSWSPIGWKNDIVEFEPWMLSWSSA